MKTCVISLLRGAIGRYMPADIRIRLIDAIKREVKKLGPKKESE